MNEIPINRLSWMRKLQMEGSCQWRIQSPLIDNQVNLALYVAFGVNATHVPPVLFQLAHRACQVSIAMLLL